MLWVSMVIWVVEMAVMELVTSILSYVNSREATKTIPIE